MKLEKWALIAEVAGGIAIFVSLIVLIVEVRGNTDALRAQTLNAQYQSERQRREILVTNDGGIADILVKSTLGQELDPVERFRLNRYYNSLLEDFEWQFGEMRAGRLPEDRLNVANWRAISANQPGLLEAFERSRHDRNPDFVDYWVRNVVAR